MSSNDSTNDITNLLKVASTVGQLFNHAGNGNANPQPFMHHNSMGMMLQPGANSMMQQPMMMQQMQPQQMQPYMMQQQGGQPFGQPWSKPRTCFNCGDKDHMARDCPKMSGKPRLSDEVQSIAKGQAELADTLKNFMSQQQQPAAQTSPMQPMQ